MGGKPKQFRQNYTMLTLGHIKERVGGGCDQNVNRWRFPEDGCDTLRGPTYIDSVEIRMKYWYIFMKWTFLHLIC